MTTFKPSLEFHTTINTNSFVYEVQKIFLIYKNKSESDLVRQIHLISLFRLKIPFTLCEFLTFNTYWFSEFSKPNLNLKYTLLFISMVRMNPWILCFFNLILLSLVIKLPGVINWASLVWKHCAKIINIFIRAFVINYVINNKKRALK